MPHYSDTPSDLSSAMLGLTEQTASYEIVMGDDRDLVYNVDAAWKRRVKAALENQGRGAQAKLAAEIGASTGQLSELLGAESKYSRLVPRIHAYFGWDPPPAPSASPDAPEVAHLVRGMPKKVRRQLAQVIGSLEGLTDEEAQERLDAVLKLLRIDAKPQPKPK